MQFVRQPATTPGNIKRVDISRATSFGGAYGPYGAGTCDELGLDTFNGAPFNKLTLVMQWHSGPPRPLLRFFVFDGHFALADLTTPGAAASALASWDYAGTGAIPSAGTEKFHFNAWQANWGAA